jgi:hypothetical protein
VYVFTSPSACTATSVPTTSSSSMASTMRGT